MTDLQGIAKPELDEHLTRSFLSDGRIVAFSIGSMSRDTLTKWSAAAGHEINNWDPTLPFLNLQDFSACPNFSFTPFLRQKSEEITSLNPNKPGRTAVIIPKSISTQIVRMFLLASGRSGQHRQRQVFFTQEDGLKWLEEWLDLSKVPAPPQQESAQ